MKKMQRPAPSLAPFKPLPLSAAGIRSFRRRIWRFYAISGRPLPFRQTTDPYAITVSEFMLQQTQVNRVLPKYTQWINTFPDWNSLARAKKVEILRAWSGLGYNRRALFLQALAREIVTAFGGQFPNTEEALHGLPGLGPYTRRAILIFAFNAPLATVDTNIRRVLIASFGLDLKISAAEVQKLAELVLPRRRARDWHYALMDYGALKLTARASGVRSLSKQSPFAGSVREVRGKLITLLTGGRGRSLPSLLRLSEFPRERVQAALAALLTDKLIEHRRGCYRIAEG